MPAHPGGARTRGAAPCDPLSRAGWRAALSWWGHRPPCGGMRTAPKFLECLRTEGGASVGGTRLEPRPRALGVRGVRARALLQELPRGLCCPVWRWVLRPPPQRRPPSRLPQALCPKNNLPPQEMGGLRRVSADLRGSVGQLATSHSVPAASGRGWFLCDSLVALPPPRSSAPGLEGSNCTFSPGRDSQSNLVRGAAGSLEGKVRGLPTSSSATTRSFHVTCAPGTQARVRPALRPTSSLKALLLRSFLPFPCTPFIHLVITTCRPTPRARPRHWLVGDSSSFPPPPCAPLSEGPLAGLPLPSQVF